MLADGSFPAGGAYYWRIYAADAAGNNATTYPLGVRFVVVPPRQTVDNSASGYSSSATWALGSYAVPYGNDYRHRRTDGSAADRATFKAMLSAGTYDVYAWYTSGTNRTTVARYNVSDSSGGRTVVVNQQTGGGAWKLLGRFTVKSGENTIRVDAANGTPGYLIADAVMWDRK